MFETIFYCIIVKKLGPYLVYKKNYIAYGNE